MRVERVEHAVARGVFDLAEIDLGAAEVVLDEREDVAQARGDVPGALDVVDAELFLLRVDADLHRRGALFVEDDDLRDVALDVVERAEEHVARLDALRVDVFLAHDAERLVDDLELGEVVRTSLIARVARGGDRREAAPEAAPAELQREGAGDRESKDDCTGFDDSFDGSGAHAALSIDMVRGSRPLDLF